MLAVFIYEEDNHRSSCFYEPFFKNLLPPQLDAVLFPDYMSPPDKKYEFRAFDDGISHSVYIWNNCVNDMGLSLAPFYFISKVVFLICRYSELYSIHEVHLQISPNLEPIVNGI